MTIPLRELALTTLLILGFFALGELVLRRVSHDLLSWNESFLVGAAACAAALFPLSLLLRDKALSVAGCLLGAALAVWVTLRVSGGKRRGPSSLGGVEPVAFTLLAAIAAVTLTFAALNLRYKFHWDGFQIWASNAQILFFEGGLLDRWYPGDGYDRRLLAYPSLIPLTGALLSGLRGGFDFDALKPIFLPFYLSMLISTFGAARARLSESLALMAALLVALIPGLSTEWAAGGYADMPLAAFVAATVAAAFRRPNSRPLPWMIGALTVVKSEGLVLATIASVAVGLSWIPGGPKNLPARVRAHWRGIAVVAAFAAVRLAYPFWLKIDDVTYQRLGGLWELKRLRLVARLCAEAMLKVSEWGLLWPTFALTGVYLLWRGCLREKCLVTAVGMGLLTYSAIFLTTNWSVELHIAQAMPRLLAQLAPAAVITILFAAARAADMVEPASYDRAEAR